VDPSLKQESTKGPKPPSLLSIAGESLSAIEIVRLLIASPRLRQQTRGNGEPVVVLPGLSAGDASTYLLRGYLKQLGYTTYGWALGRNHGDFRSLVPKVKDRVRGIWERSDRPVHIIGWSFGGILAREVGRDHPHMVAQVITMGSPIVGGSKYTSLAGLYESRGADLDKMEASIDKFEKTPIKVPLTSIYTKRDGVVGWQASIDRYNSHTDHIEVDTTHLGLGFSPEVFEILAKKLAEH